MASSTVPSAKPGERVKIDRRLYEYGQRDGKTFSYYADVEIDGRQTRKKLAATSRTAARREQENLNADNNRKLVAPPTKKTVGEIGAEWLEQLDVRPRTLESYSYHFHKNIAPYLGSRQVQSLRPKDCAALWPQLRDQRKLSAETGAGAFRTLHALLEYAIEQELLISNPLTRVKKRPQRAKPRQRQASHRYLKPEEIMALLAAATETYEPVFYVAIWTGMRMSEVLGLTWGDIDLTARKVNVSMQLSRATKDRPGERVPVKTDLPREIDIDDELVSYFKERKEQAFAQGRAKVSDYVFTTEAGMPLHFRNVGKAFDAAAKKAKLNPEGRRKLRFHDLRRTYASILISGGCEAPYVAQQLGHSVEILYSTYTGLFEAREGEQRERGAAARQAARGQR
jgi:integrase